MAAEPISDDTYFQQYYEKNRGKINANRKRRYHEDPEYRDRVLSASRKYRDRNRVSPKVRIPRHQVPLTVETPDGVEVRLFSVGAFATYLSRSVQSINHWEKNEVLPKTPYRDGRGFRYYTAEMMQAVKGVVGSKRRLFPIDHLRGQIEDAWLKLGVPLGVESGLVEALAATQPPEPEDIAV